MKKVILFILCAVICFSQGRSADKGDRINKWLKDRINGMEVQMNLEYT